MKQILEFAKLVARARIGYGAACAAGLLGLAGIAAGLTVRDLKRLQDRERVVRVRVANTMSS